MTSDVKTMRLSVTSSSCTPDDEGVKLEETCGFEIGCGPFKRRSAPSFQRFATTRWALAFFCVGGFLQGFIVNGHTSAIISTLEKRFELTSTESGLIASFYDIAGLLAVVFVTYVGGNGHKPLWIGWGIFLIGMAGIIFSFPHFIAPQYTFVDAINVCGNSTEWSCGISHLKNFRFLFYGAMILAGVGASPLYSLGITFLDENVKQRYSSMYNGILIMMSLIGPGLGYLVAGAFLSLYTYPDVEVSIDDSNELWVGAWWIGCLIAGILAVLGSVPVLMLPRVIPGTEKHRIGREKEMHCSAKEDGVDSAFGEKFKDFPKCVAILFRNPTFVFESLAIALDSVIISGMAVFGAKYLETQFGFDPSDAGTYFGLMAILGGAGGELIGGWLISRYNIKVRWMLHICYVAPFLCAIAACGFLITCSQKVFAGVTVAYDGDDVGGSFDLTSQCNSACACDDRLYDPVCGSDGVTYFSSCHAGCSEKMNGVYSNCSCVSSSGNQSSLSTAISGVCVDERCISGWEIIVFCLCNFLIMFFTFFNEAAAIQVSLRCVSFNRRSFGIGVQTLLIRAIGTVPGPLVVGAIFDAACIRSSKCEVTGSCLAYNNTQLAFYLFLFVAILKLIDAGLFLGALRTYKPISGQLDERLSDYSPKKTDVTSADQSNTITNTTSLPGGVGETTLNDFFSNPAFTDQ